MGADDVEALALEDRGDAGEQVVVAAAKRQREFRQALDRAPIEAQVGELRPGQAADQRDVGDALGAQGREQLAELADAQPDVSEGLDRRVRGAD